MIEQIDRDAAIELATIIFGNGHSLVAELRTAERHFMLDAFARHRAAGMERAAVIADGFDAPHVVGVAKRIATSIRAD